MSACRTCSHSREMHEHLRRGSDCAQCPCRSFSTSALAAAVSLFFRRPARPAVVVAAPTVTGRAA